MMRSTHTAMLTITPWAMVKLAFRALSLAVTTLYRGEATGLLMIGVES